MTTTNFTKIVRLGTVPVSATARVSVYCKIKYKDGRLSITGVEGPKRGGSAAGGTGQIIMSYESAEERDQIEFAPGWRRSQLDRFFDIWDEWHLNDMSAGSPRQTAWVRTNRARLKREYASTWSKDSYTITKQGLADAHLEPDEEFLVDVETAPDVVEQRPYSYGSKWLRIEVPDDVLDFLRSLPDSDQEPAWI